MYILLGALGDRVSPCCIVKPSPPAGSTPEKTFLAGISLQGCLLTFPMYY